MFQAMSRFSQGICGTRRDSVIITCNFEWNRKKTWSGKQNIINRAVKQLTTHTWFLIW